MNYISQTIIKHRKERGMTQSELAKKLYVSDKAVSKWETRRGLPDLSTLERISKEFNITIDYLVTGENNQSINYEVEDLKTQISNMQDAIDEQIRVSRGKRMAAIVLVVVLIISSLLYMLMPIKLNKVIYEGEISSISISANYVYYENSGIVSSNNYFPATSVISNEDIEEFVETLGELNYSRYGFNGMGVEGVLVTIHYADGGRLNLNYKTCIYTNPNGGNKKHNISVNRVEFLKVINQFWDVEFRDT